MINESTEKPLVEAIDGNKIYNYMYTLHFVDWGEGYRNSLEENIYAIRYNWQAGKKREKKWSKEFNTNLFHFHRLRMKDREKI